MIICSHYLSTYDEQYRKKWQFNFLIEIFKLFFDNIDYYRWPGPMLAENYMISTYRYSFWFWNCEGGKVSKMQVKLFVFKVKKNPINQMSQKFRAKTSQLLFSFKKIPPLPPLLHSYNKCWISLKSSLKFLGIYFSLLTFLCGN